MRIVGAVLGGLVDWLLEHYWYKAGQPQKFPYIEIVPQLPPVDDLLVLAGSGAVNLIGDITRSEAIKQIGEGMFLYSIGMFTHHILLRNITRK